MENIITECDCKCTIMTINKIDENTFNIIFYSNYKNMKNNKYPQDLILTKNKLKEFSVNINKMLED